MRCWLMKSEPDEYSFDDLVADGRTLWDGVRNYQARNMMRDDVQVGDRVLFYHSRSQPPHVVGVAEVVRAGYPDPTQFDPEAKYFDAKARPDNPRWFVVDIAPVGKLARVVTLDELKGAAALDGMLVIKKGQRLSVQPVEQAHFDAVVEMGGGIVG